MRYIMLGLVLLTLITLGLMLITTQYLKPVILSDSEYFIQHKQNKPNIETIYYDNYGFEPNILNTPINSTVIVKNISNKGPLLFEALYNQPNQNPALDLGTINQGQSKSFVITKSGVWQYEANNNPSIRGIIGTSIKSTFQNYMIPDKKLNIHTLLIKYDDYGFVPNQVTVPINTRIILQNVTDNTQPGPSFFELTLNNRSEYVQQNIGLLQKQQTKSFTLNKLGNWLLEDIYQPKAKARAQISTY